RPCCASSGSCPRPDRARGASTPRTSPRRGQREGDVCREPALPAYAALSFGRVSSAGPGRSLARGGGPAARRSRGARGDDRHLDGWGVVGALEGEGVVLALAGGVDRDDLA